MLQKRVAKSLASDSAAAELFQLLAEYRDSQGIAWLIATIKPKAAELQEKLAPLQEAEAEARKLCEEAEAAHRLGPDKQSRQEAAGARERLRRAQGQLQEVDNPLRKLQRLIDQLEELATPPTVSAVQQVLHRAGIL